ncbi:MAG TPA: GH25 family lysozyme, partial [Chitinophagaceae bacterium]|nr:GH25 family lysozyme [Chitinophagaceae bacterium]
MLTGIDVSHFSSFNQQQLKAMVNDHRLYFNFLKATEGATLQDSKFVQYWQMSGLAGMLCGAYHFFRPLSDVTAQVNNFTTMYRK